MKIKFLPVIACFMFTSAFYGQNAGVEKNIYGVQAGFLGVWAQNETRLSPSIALRTEVGLDLAVFSHFSDIGFLLTPVLTAEPRWYYNFSRRGLKNRQTSKNAANFVGIKGSFRPDWFVLGNSENVSVPDQIDFIPKWGIRRVLGSHFTYEAGAGIGYRIYPNATYANEAALDLHIRMGYTF